MSIDQLEGNTLYSTIEINNMYTYTNMGGSQKYMPSERDQTENGAYSMTAHEVLEQRVLTRSYWQRLVGYLEPGEGVQAKTFQTEENL